MPHDEGPIRFNSRPKVSIERSILNSFTHVARFDTFLPFQISERAAHLQNSIVGASRERPRSGLC